MKNNKYKEISTTNSRNKKYELKSKLTSLADKAKNRINKNKFLRELISIEKNQIRKRKIKKINQSLRNKIRINLFQRKRNNRAFIK